VTRNYRTQDAEEYRKLYRTAQWQTLRKQILLRDKYQCQHQRCGTILTSGRTNPRSAVVHHKTPHKGNLDLFFNPDNLVSVCKACHDGPIQSQEALGYDKAIGEDGWPVDPNHPAGGG
jgi:5-methylcytosine-specific restriction enzyme A